MSRFVRALEYSEMYSRNICKLLDNAREFIKKSKKKEKNVWKTILTTLS